MWKKSAIRAVSKLCPQSSELDRYLEVLPDPDDRAQQRISSFAQGQLPDDESLERTRFELKTSALAALSDATTVEACDQIFRDYTSECQKIDESPEIEVEAKRGDRIDAIKQGAIK
jgi:hypothetical protein